MLDLGVGGGEVILKRGEAVITRNVSETNSVAVLEQLGIVLHEAFEPCGRLEFGLGGVSVFGVDKLVDEALCAAQHLNVGVQLQHETVCVAGESAKTEGIDWLAA